MLSAEDLGRDRGLAAPYVTPPGAPAAAGPPLSSGPTSGTLLHQQHLPLLCLGRAAKLLAVVCVFIRKKS
jgi:hypothetical protein